MCIKPCIYIKSRSHILTQSFTKREVVRLEARYSQHHKLLNTNHASFDVRVTTHSKLQVVHILKALDKGSRFGLCSTNYQTYKRTKQDIC